jgi:TonB family protein
MTNFSAKLAGALALALLAGCTSIPQPVASALAQDNIDTPASVTYQDDNGNAVDAREFVTRLAANGKFDLLKSGPTATPDVTARLRPLHENVFNKLRLGDALPDFHLRRVDGQAIDNRALDGKFTLIDFYSAKFDRSETQVPLLNALAKRHPELNLLAITYDSATEARTFVEKHGLAIPVLPDARELIDRIGNHGYPTLALFDRQGKLVDASSGIGRLKNPVLFETWLSRQIAAIDPTTTPAVLDFRTCGVPIYPLEDLRARHTGTVTLNFLVGADGRVKQAGIDTSSGHASLDRAALASLSRCQFKPAIVSGVPQEKWSLVQYKWSM